LALGLDLDGGGATTLFLNSFTRGARTREYIITNWPASTYGVLTLVMIRVVALVDAVSELVTGIETNVRMNMSTVRFQAASLWSKGIYGDLDVGPGSPDDDEWFGLPDT
jgi:hypothetical protein